MEILIGDRADYFSTAEEAVEKISYYLTHEDEIKNFFWKNKIDEDGFTSNRKVKQLMILIERYLKEEKGVKWILP